jgi:hypothetical protein
VIGKKIKAKSGSSARISDVRGKVLSARGKTGNKGAVYIFWLVFFVLIICLFIVNLDGIQTSLRNTGIADRLSNRPRREQDAPPPGLNDGDSSSTGLPLSVPSSGQDGGDSGSGFSTVSREPDTPLGGTPASSAVPSAETPDGQAVPATGPQESGGQGQPPPQTAPVVPSVEIPAGQPPAVLRERDGQGQPVARTTPENRRERVLYFMQVDPDGTIMRTRVNRSLPVTDSPLTQVLTALLQGPSAEETLRGLITLIPKGTRLLSIEVKDPTATAYINFNENFLFNEFGVEGYAGQLRQLIWTVTEFPNIKDVQILVEGRRLDYLGESIWIGSPVGRESR